MTEDGRRSPLHAAGRLAFRPARAAARASRGPLENAADDVLVPEILRILDRALAGSLPEELIDSVIANHVLERMVAELTATDALEQAIEQALASPRTKELMDQLVRSEAMSNAIHEVVAGPAVREALRRETRGFADEVAEIVRGRAVGYDGRLEHAVSRRRRVARPFDAGLVTRGGAFVVDAILILAILTACSAFAAIVSSLVGELRPTWLAALLLAWGALIVAAGYLVLFWSSTGRTPGMYLMRLRVRDHRGLPPSIGRSIVRVVATWISIVPFFAGYLPVLFDARRRGLPDFVAGTEVVYDDKPALELSFLRRTRSRPRPKKRPRSRGTWLKKRANSERTLSDTSHPVAPPAFVGGPSQLRARV